MWIHHPSSSRRSCGTSKPQLIHLNQSIVPMTCKIEVNNYITNSLIPSSLGN
uniref:Uncharacterized protein n=1 Tax=viral metagenome TaxID=1070528 RepID=A0A6C0BM18_9ZZZZ